MCFRVEDCQVEVNYVQEFNGSFAVCIVVCVHALRITVVGVETGRAGYSSSVGMQTVKGVL